MDSGHGCGRSMSVVREPQARVALGHASCSSHPGLLMHTSGKEANACSREDGVACRSRKNSISIGVGVDVVGSRVVQPDLGASRRGGRSGYPLMQASKLCMRAKEQGAMSGMHRVSVRSRCFVGVFV